ncbi:hypothetical protein ACH5RR_038458 [Cinchona calisaya]|uniref:KIB1-4 beta-propeller domain-containing protein n=1 Tax=Cinchona calisaya TaxID=153742 RepID=A0ABD2XZG0_9GENT
MGGDWSELLQDLLVMIAKRIQLVEDFTAFSGVCTSWRAAASKQNFEKSWPTLPMLMLAEKKDSDDREFYSLSRGKIWRTLPLPEAKGKKCIETRGWLLTITSSGDMKLLHPFSRVQIELPHLTFPYYECDEYEDGEERPYSFIRRAVLSANPSETSNFVLMVVHSCGTNLGFWRSGDKSWTGIVSRQGAFSDVNYHNGKFYAISYGGQIWSWDVTAPDLTVAQRIFCIDVALIRCRESYVVESSGELLIVSRDGAGISSDCETYGATNFRVIQLDIMKSRWNELSSLGERAIFVGFNGAFSVDSTSFPGIIRPNCIYFTDDSDEAFRYTNSQLGGGKDMGVYNLEDGKIERFEDVRSFSLICPPIWVSPSL